MNDFFLCVVARHLKKKKFQQINTMTHYTIKSKYYVYDFSRARDRGFYSKSKQNVQLIKKRSEKT